MTKRHDKKRPRPARVGEPVQVYLAPPDRERLERLARDLDTTRSDVLRRGLEALEAAAKQARDPRGRAAPLPTYRGKGLQPGVDLDDTAALMDLMDGTDAAR
jgi:hypothetical protein